MRKGLLASVALVLGHTAAQAQYWPAQRPYYQPQPNQAPVWIVPQQAPVYSQQQAPRAAYPASNVPYLPQGYFPQQQVMLPVPLAAQGTPVPPEPARTEPVPANVSVPAKTVARPVATTSPTYYYQTLPSTTVTRAPVEPVVYHRECNERWWTSFDYLTAWIKNAPLRIPLVTTGSVTDTDPGALDEPGTIVLYGNRRVDFRMFQGVRLEVGRFLDDENRFSVDASGFYFLPRHVRFQRASDDSGLPILGRPVFNVTQGDEDVFQISSPELDPDFPVIIAGRTSVDSRAQMLGAEINGRWHCYRGSRLHTEVLGGFRTMRLEEHLQIRDQIQPLTDDSGLTFNGNPVFAGDILTDQDRFRTENQFYGFQVGGKLRWEMDRAYVDLVGKVALGVTDQRARIEGVSTLSSAGLFQSAVGGILALPSNIGEHNRQVFGAIPEIGVNVGVDVTNHLRFKAGYSLIVWNGVTRPGLLIDRSVNPSQIPTDQDFASVAGPTAPVFRFREEVFFLQTLNFGFEFHY